MTPEPLIPELLVNEHCSTGENPLWDEVNSLVYWCDIPVGKIFALDLATNTHRLVYQGPECGAFGFQEDGSLLLLRTGTAALLDPATGQITATKEGIVSDTGRFNDCITDPRGRVFSGTVDWVTNIKGALFSLGFDLKATMIDTGTACSNGFGFTADLKGLYWSDSTRQTVYLFDYDEESGQLSNQRPWLQTPGLTPDGMTVDAAGNPWVAFYNGPFLRHYNADGTLIQQVDIPAAHVTSCIFGGEKMDQLFVTTAGGKPDSDNNDGALFRLRPGVGGPPRFRSKVTL